MQAWCCKFHNLTELSLPPDAIKALLLETVIRVTGPLWIDFHNFVNLLAIIDKKKKRIRVRVLRIYYIYSSLIYIYKAYIKLSHYLSNPIIWTVHFCDEWICSCHCHQEQNNLLYPPVDQLLSHPTMISQSFCSQTVSKRCLLSGRISTLRLHSTAMKRLCYGCDKMDKFYQKPTCTSPPV